MRSTPRSLLVATAAVVVAQLVVASAHAGIWTNVPSGTTAAIDAIEYQGPDRFWYVTDDGRIYRRHPTSTVVELATPFNFNDVAAQAAPGAVALAVTSTGQLYRADNGPWSQVSMTGATRAHLCPGSGGPYPAVTPGGPFVVVEFANASTAYIVGETGMVLRSLDAGQSWTDISRLPDGTCRMPGRAVDVAFDPTAPQIGYFLTDDGRVFKTTDGLATPAQLVGGPFCGPLSTGRTIVLDAAAPQRLFQSTWCAGAQTVLGSRDGGRSFAAPSWPFGAPGHVLRDLSFAGGTLVGAGYNDTIVTSPDGINAFLQPVGTGTTWHTIDLASASAAAVGGDGGALALTSQANSVPPPPPPPDVTAPTGTIVGAATATAGQTIRYALQAADEPGGSGIDPRSFVWTIDGRTISQSSAIRFTFRISGQRRFVVTFKDRAGHAAGAAKTVRVARATTTPSAKPVKTKVKRRRSRATFEVQGRMDLPPGVDPADGCRGDVRLTPFPHRAHAKPIHKGATAAFRRARKGSGADCIARETFSVSATRLRRGTRVVDVRVEFRGNEAILAGSWCRVQTLAGKKRRGNCATHG